MAYLNSKALALIANALQDAEDIYTKLAENPEVPERLQRDFSAQRHMAGVLAELFESHPAFNAENVDTAEYCAFIWES